MTVAGQISGESLAAMLAIAEGDAAAGVKTGQFVSEHVRLALTELQHRREAEDDARKKIHRLHAEYAGHRDALPIDSLDRRFAQVCVELTSDILRMFPQADAPNSALGEHP